MNMQYSPSIQSYTVSAGAILGAVTTSYLAAKLGKHGQAVYVPASLRFGHLKQMHTRSWSSACLYTQLGTLVIGMTWRQVVHDEVREDSIWLQSLHCGAGKGPVKGPEAGANEVEEGPGGQSQPCCQAHGLHQLLQQQ